MNLILAFLLMLPAFPGAQGFGSQTVGGSGRHLSPPNTTIFKIKSLEDSGPETLRECIDAAMPRVCVFETSGIITLKSNLRVTTPYLTIAGETAPAPGITIRNGELGVLSHDVVVRHLHVRAGDDPAGSDPGSRGGIGFYGDAPTNPGAYNILVDHLSLSWSIDELADTWYEGVHDITLSNSILAEPLYQSIHPMGPQGTNGIVGADAKNFSLIRNLLAHGFSRNPYAKGGNSVEMINNLVYHWGFGKSGNTGEWAMVDLSDYDRLGKPSLWNFIANIFKPGPDSWADSAPVFSSAGADALPSGSHVYVKGNVGPGRPVDTGDDWNITNGLAKPLYCTSQPAVRGSTVTPLTASGAVKAVLREAGAFPEERDVVDSRIVAEVHAGTGQFINCVAPDGTERCAKNAGGWPQVPEHKRELAIPDNANDLAASGYTRLEEWLHTFPISVDAPEPVPTAAPPEYPPCQ